MTQGVNGAGGVNGLNFNNQSLDISDFIDTFRALGGQSNRPDCCGQGPALGEMGGGLPELPRVPISVPDLGFGPGIRGFIPGTVVSEGAGSNAIGGNGLIYDIGPDNNAYTVYLAPQSQDPLGQQPQPAPQEDDDDSILDFIGDIAGVAVPLIGALAPLAVPLIGGFVGGFGGGGKGGKGKGH